MKGIYEDINVLPAQTASYDKQGALMAVIHIYTFVQIALLNNYFINVLCEKQTIISTKLLVNDTK